MATLAVACGSDQQAASNSPSTNIRSDIGGSSSGIGGSSVLPRGGTASPSATTGDVGGTTSQLAGGGNSTLGGRNGSGGVTSSTTGGRSAPIGGNRANGGESTTFGVGMGGVPSGGAALATGGKVASGGVAAGGSANGGVSLSTGGRVAGGGAATGGSANGGGSLSTGGKGAGGASGASVGGSAACDLSEPPSSVAAWIDESWTAEGRNNMSGHKTWLHDAAMKGQGTINLCVRYGATQSVTVATRDQIAPSMQRWFNKWFAQLYSYACFPYPSVTVKVTGWAVKPGQESLLQWTDRTVPVYTEVSDGSDQAQGEPKCPDACGFFFHSDHVFSNCPGGATNHFDYSLWLDDKLASGAAAEGSDWGVRIPVASFFSELKTDNFGVMLHEMGHGFGLSDYYSWKGSMPTGGSVMFAGSAGVLTLGDTWMVRRYWKETKALRYP